MQRIRTLLRSSAPLWHYDQALNFCHFHPVKQISLPISRLFSTVAQTFASHGKVDIQVGATLQLKFSQSDAELNVWTSDNLEEVELKALSKRGMDSIFPFDLVTKNNHVCIALECDKTRAYLQKLGVVIPDRWCSLVLEGGKGDVIIEDMKEANAHVTTVGGNIRLGEMRANKAFFKSTGGAISARLISGILNLSTDGGDVYLKKAIGTTMQIDTAGGKITIGSVYGGGLTCFQYDNWENVFLYREIAVYDSLFSNDHEDVELTSGGGCIEVKHIQAQGKAIVSTSGGHVKIDGLDGNAEIISCGGNIEVQLLQNAKEIKIDAGIGDVTIYASSGKEIHIENTKEWESNQEGPPENISATGQETRVVISSSRNVVMKERSWLNAVMGSTVLNSG